MARRVKPKISYKKNKKTPKASVGAVTAAVGIGKSIYGASQLKRAKKAEAGFDQSRLYTKVSSATTKLADQPIDENYIERMQQQQAADRASAMGALAKDPRNVLAGVSMLEDKAAKQRIDLMGKQEEARTRAMENLAREQVAVGERKADVATEELAGIKAEKDAGVQNIFSGLEDVASGASAIAKRGANIDSEEGGVTPGEFNHNNNPIDMVQDGEKIGEATGGELILPPDDVEDIRTALQSEDKDEAFELMQRLVDKYDSNTIGDDEDKADMGASIPKDKVSKIMRYVMRKDMDGSLLSENYAEIAREELNLTDKEVKFLESYAKSRKS
jgi:hypothetical protein